VIRLALVLLLLVSGSASAVVIERAAPLSAGSYSVQGTGASAEFQRMMQQPYRTASGRSLSIPITDAIRPGKANIAKMLAKRMLVPGGPALLAASVLAPAVLSMFADDNATIQNGSFIRSFTRYRFSASGSNFGGTSYYETHNDVCRAVYTPANGWNGVYGTTAGCSANYGTCYKDGNFPLTALCAVRRTETSQAATQPMTDVQLESAVMNEPDTDTGLNSAMAHLVESNVELTFDGSEAAVLSATPQETPAYDASTTTRADGGTETTSTKDRVETQPQGNNGPVAGNKATTTETKTTTKTTPEGTTTTVAIIDNGTPEQAPVKTCGTAGDLPCSTIEQGTFSAPPSGSLPTIPGAKTFQQSTADFLAAVQTAPLFAFAASLSLPAGGACPTVPITIDFLDFAGTFDSHCAIVEEIGPTLGSVMLAFWLLVAVRRVMSA
jgi:hypothetical protein